MSRYEEEKSFDVMRMSKKFIGVFFRFLINLDFLGCGGRGINYQVYKVGKVYSNSNSNYRVQEFVNKFVKKNPTNAVFCTF